MERERSGEKKTERRECRRREERLSGKVSGERDWRSIIGRFQHGVTHWGSIGGV